MFVMKFYCSLNIILIIFYQCFKLVSMTNITSSTQLQFVELNNKENRIIENINYKLKNKTNFKVDYKNVYKLRFDPTDIKFHLKTSTISPVNRQQYNENTTNFVVLENLNNKQINLINSKLLSTEKTVPNDNLIFHNDINSELQTTTVSNIMRPNTSSGPPNGRFNNNFALILMNLKNLLFGKAGTIVKPPNPTKSFLNIFDIIQFENIPCSAIIFMKQFNGTCYHKIQCDNLGGRSIGNCANRLGVCCIFKYSCGDSTKELISYFESPKFPLATSDALSCTFGIDLMSGVRQIRLDFLFFELKPPNNGNCDDDKFVVSGQNINSFIPVLCGINSGQHIYIEVENSMERKLFLSVVGESLVARAFSMRVLQLRNNLAPQNCLQYYTEDMGYIKSFNYENIANIVETRFPSYFNNLNYAICIQRSPNKCQITYRNVIKREEFPFQLINIDDEQTSLVPPGQAGVEIFSCPDDYIIINGIRLCGDKLNDANSEVDFASNAPITDTGSGPIVLKFRTNNNNVGRGFKLHYIQQSCI